MDLNTLKKLYHSIESECKAIEESISSQEKSRNAKVRNKLKHLKSSLHSIARLIQSKEQSFIAS